MFNTLVKHVFGPGQHPDNHTELIKNCQGMESTHEGESQFLHIEYKEHVFDREKMWFSEESREKIFALPVSRYLDVAHMVRELVKKANELCGNHPNADRVRDKFLKVVIKHYPEPVSGLGGEILNPPADMMSQVEIGLTNDGEHYDEGEHLIYWSRIQA